MPVSTIWTLGFPVQNSVRTTCMLVSGIEINRDAYLRRAQRAFLGVTSLDLVELRIERSGFEPDQLCSWTRHFTLTHSLTRSLSRSINGYWRIIGGTPNQLLGVILDEGSRLHATETEWWAAWLLRSINLVPRVSHLPRPLGWGDERPWERGCRSIGLERSLKEELCHDILSHFCDQSFVMYKMTFKLKET